VRGPAWLAVGAGVMLTVVPQLVIPQAHVPWADIPWAVIRGAVIPQAQAQQPAFVVFFEQWSAALDGSAQDVITKAADYARTHPSEVTRVTGFADPTGSRQANILLSELRAQVVVDGLTAAGIPANRIRKTGRGSVQFAATPLEARRVEIRVGG
jgi:outer membrane protein OmpA-like peptidoglycan-associated protein